MIRKLSDVVGRAMFRKTLRQQLRSPLYRNALFLMTNRGVTSVIGLVFWLLAAKLYLDKDVGLASAIISSVLLLSLIATMGLDYALIRFLPNAGRDSDALVNSCLTVAGLMSIVVALVFIAGISLWSPALLFLRQDPVLIGAFIVFTVGWTLYVLVSRTFVARRRAGYSLVQGIIFNIFRLILIIVLATFFAAFGIFAAWGIAVVVAVGIATLLLLPRVQAGYRPLPVIKRDVLNEMMRFSFANYVAILLWTAPILILPLMVLNLLGAESNAYFYIAWSIANILFSVPIAISLSLFTEGSHDEERLGRDTRRSLRLILLVIVPSVLLILLLGDKLLFLFDPAYAENATTLLWVLAFSAVPLSLNHIYFGVKRVQMRMKSVIGLTAFMAVATLVLSGILLPRMGILGAGIAWLSAQSAVALVIIMLWLPHIRMYSSR